MKSSLTVKISLAFLLVTVTTALLVALFIRLTGVQQVERLLAEQRRSMFEEMLVSYYSANGSWQGVEQYVHQVWGMPRQAGANANPHNMAPMGMRGDPLGLTDAQGQVIMPMLPEYRRGERVAQEALRQCEPVEVDGQVVGYLLADPEPPGLSQVELAYLKRTNLALWVASAVAVLFAVLIGWILAKRLTHSLRQLTFAAGEMAQGKLEQQVEVKSDDEIGQLSAAFNQMSQKLAQANQVRRQMTADIAHDLRTPLTVMAGYVEAMQEGVLEPTPERLELIYREIERLQSMVGDLRLLSQADAGEVSYRLQPINPRALLEQMARLFQHQAQKNNVSLSVMADENLPSIPLDEDRMAQVFANLISNSLSYTSAGGEIFLKAYQDGQKVVFTVQDNGAGIPPDALPHIFERFYRADTARQEDGGSGLGLAIARALVEGQGGSIHAESTPGQGTIIRMMFPIQVSERSPDSITPWDPRKNKLTK